MKDVLSQPHNAVFYACDFYAGSMGAFMPLPTLAKLKAQCRIDENNSLEDELLLTYLMAAKKRAENYINRTIYENDVPNTDPDGVALSADIELALLLAVDHFYENRETITVPAGFKALIEPYRYLNVG